MCDKRKCYVLFACQRGGVSNKPTLGFGQRQDTGSGFLVRPSPPIDGLKGRWFVSRRCLEPMRFFRRPRLAGTRQYRFDYLLFRPWLGIRCYFAIYSTVNTWSVSYVASGSVIRELSSTRYTPQSGTRPPSPSDNACLTLCRTLSIIWCLKWLNHTGTSSKITWNRWVEITHI